MYILGNAGVYCKNGQIEICTAETPHLQIHTSLFHLFTEELLWQPPCSTV
jgi:hypothetical protein